MEENKLDDNYIEWEKKQKRIRYNICGQPNLYFIFSEDIRNNKGQIIGQNRYRYNKRGK